MKLKRVSNTSGEHYGWRFHCPGCDDEHVIDRTWKCDGDPERPTISPSILVYAHKTCVTDAKGELVRDAAGDILTKDSFRCHSFVSNGRIQFLADSTHPLAGKTVELPDLAEES